MRLEVAISAAFPTPPSKNHPAKRQKGRNHAYRTLNQFVVSLVRCCFTGDTGSIPSTSCCGHLCSDWSADIACLRPANLPRTGLHLGPRLLGLRSRWLLLGSRHVGLSSGSRPAVDSGLLGLG